MLAIKNSTETPIIFPDRQQIPSNLRKSHLHTNDTQKHNISTPQQMYRTQTNPTTKIT